MNFRFTVIKRFFTDKKIRFGYLSALGFYNKMPDKQYLEKMWKIQMGYELNLENPQTFNEKLQWLKLYDQNPEYIAMVDKYEVKKYVTEKIGEKYIIPTLGVWEHFDDIKFNELPDQFVLKCTHDSGGLVIVKDKSILNIKAAKKKIEKSLKKNYYLNGREWPYKNVKPRIIAEKYITDVISEKNLKNHEADQNKSNNDFIEYKMFCFNGEPRLFMVCKGQAHGQGRTNDFYDLDFNHIPVELTNPNANTKEKKPKQYNELIWLAKILSKNIPHVRVDTYVVNDNIFFGELTFYHDSGLCYFRPDIYDKKLGTLLQLPNIKINHEKNPNNVIEYKVSEEK